MGHYIGFTLAWFRFQVLACRVFWCAAGDPESGSDVFGALHVTLNPRAMFCGQPCEIHGVWCVPAVCDQLPWIALQKPQTEQH